MHCTTLHCATLDCTTLQCNVLLYTALYFPAGEAVLVAYRGLRLTRHFTASPALLRTIHSSRQYSALLSSLLCTLYYTLHSEYYFTQEAGTLPLTLSYLPPPISSKFRRIFLSPHPFLHSHHSHPPLLSISVYFSIKCCHIIYPILLNINLYKTFPCQAMPPCYAPWPHVMQYNTSRPISLHPSVSHHVTSRLVSHHVTSSLVSKCFKSL